jgi:hypothetical protein
MLNGRMLESTSRAVPPQGRSRPTLLDRRSTRRHPVHFCAPVPLGLDLQTPGRMPTLPCRIPSCRPHLNPLLPNLAFTEIFHYSSLSNEPLAVDSRPNACTPAIYSPWKQAAAEPRRTRLASFVQKEEIGFVSCKTHNRHRPHPRPPTSSPERTQSQKRTPTPSPNFASPTLSP